MSKTILVGDLLRLKAFDPMNVNVTHIMETIGRIPKDGTIDINQAEQLATIFLRCADYCDGLLAQAIRYSGYKDAEKRSQKASAIERKIANNVAQTTARETYSNDAEFVAASDANTDAQAFLSWITQKRDNLVKAHVLCKDLMKAHQGLRNVSGWDAGDEDFSEKSGNMGGKTSIRSKADDDFNFEIDID